MTIDELLCKFQGKCWHEWKEIYLTNNHTVSSSPIHVCKHCDIERYAKNDNPDFSDDRVAMELLRWFFKEKEGMFMEFYDYMDIVAEDFLLLKKVDGKQYMSWVVLLAEWLRLEETRKEESHEQNKVGRRDEHREMVQR